LETVIAAAKPALEKGDYTTALKAMADLRETVDNFFDHVMVMVDNEKVRLNRLALLQSLRDLFLQVADISKLQH
jgi:glycyl-tRNA synthetase beta chain